MKDVVVIGAGMAGISCALAIVRRGVSAVVLERSQRQPWWPEHINPPLSQISSERSLKELLDIRFEFHVDRLSRIDGSNVLVAWSGAVPVKALCKRHNISGAVANRRCAPRPALRWCRPCRRARHNVKVKSPRGGRKVGLARIVSEL